MKKKKVSAEKTEKDILIDISSKLEALIKFEIVKSRNEMGSKFNLADPAKILQSSGLQPADIARILDKKGSTSVSYLLYDKKGDKNER